MDGVSAALAGGFEDAIAVEVALARWRRSDPISLVRVAHVERLAVGVGVYRDRRDAEVATRAQDPQGDLAAVGHQDLLEHVSSPGGPLARSAVRSSGRP